MNTLKLKLLAASMFACSAAFAQSAGGQISGPPATRTPTDTRNNFTAQPVSTRQGGSYYADSYVLQNGNSQYANVDQSGYFNTADIYQNYNNAAGRGGNNATQQQTNDGRDGAGRRNTAYIAQEGSGSNAAQTQLGTSNVASIQQQGAGMHNNATQQQTGSNNSADITQGGSDNNAIQFQDGSNETARITQGNASGSYAEQRQFGGSANQATTTQSAPYATFSYTEQNGSNNQATVNQH